MSERVALRTRSVKYADMEATDWSSVIETMERDAKSRAANARQPWVVARAQDEIRVITKIKQDAKTRCRERMRANGSTI